MPRWGKLDAAVLLIGVVVAVASGILFYLVSETKAVLSFVVGIQLGLLSLQLELVLKDRHAEDNNTRQNRIVSRIEALPGMPEIMDRLLASTEAVEKQFNGTAAIEATRQILTGCIKDLKRLEEGHILTDYEDNVLLMDQLAQTRKSVRATSLQELDLEWWESTLGQRYTKVMVEAIKRGVHVERIFIYSDWNSSIERLADEHEAAGVHVLRVHRDALRASLRIDMIVWDERCAYEAQVNEPGGAHRNLFTLVKEEIHRNIDIYNRIYGLAEELKGGLVSCELH